VFSLAWGAVVTGMDIHVDVEPDALARPVSPPTS
jgi:hypothetical protein